MEGRLEGEMETHPGETTASQVPDTNLSVSHVWPRFDHPSDENETFFLSYIGTIVCLPSFWGIILMHAANIMRMVFPADKKLQYHPVPMIWFMVDFLLMLGVIGVLHWKSRGSSYDVSTRTMVRFFFFADVTCTILILVLQYASPFVLQYANSVETFGLWTFLAFLLPIGISVYFSILPGTAYERGMRFFGLNPATIRGAHPYQLMRFDQILWGIRIIALAACIGLSYFYVLIVSATCKRCTSSAKVAMVSYLANALQEELFKTLLMGSLSIIPKYKRKVKTMLWIAYIASATCGYAEAAQYFLMVHPHVYLSIVRVMMTFVHGVMTFPIAIAISRQRGEFSWQWILEMLGALTFSVVWHGTNNFVVTQIPETSVLFIMVDIAALFLFFYLSPERMML